MAETDGTCYSCKFFKLKVRGDYWFQSIGTCLSHSNYNSEMIASNSCPAYELMENEEKKTVYEISTDIEKQYTFYLKLMNLKEEEMHPQQKIETKRAFYGGCAQMLVLCHETLPALPMHQALKVFQSMRDQIGVFMDNEIKNNQKKIINGKRKNTRNS